MAKPVPEIARSRVLSDEELAAIIQAARKMGYPYGWMVEFLVLTAQRRGEVADLVWDELDLVNGVWCLPGNRTKNGRSHIVHLASEARALLAKVSHRSGYVFGLQSSIP